MLKCVIILNEKKHLNMGLWIGQAWSQMVKWKHNLLVEYFCTESAAAHKLCGPEGASIVPEDTYKHSHSSLYKTRCHALPLFRHLATTSVPWCEPYGGHCINANQASAPPRLTHTTQNSKWKVTRPYAHHTKSNPQKNLTVQWRNRSRSSQDVNKKQENITLILEKVKT